ncbi:MAG: hypothetical protein DRO90_01535 [Candidatus Altiarchaeales archaeon]|nr:MAG: hypothetical protein DRO95_01765 [Candidatus Altiarchaeales archaeon]RLI94731.1 MAG: hypothetical protein DRO90_01535 [Candidatus Altiarchaeales archaeon]RLI94837.1 MAG: hypothetical protein DRO94_02000 [Candidatus Altiarchaeales archaeon]HDO82697.1 DUF359 domain-containing protein [Candidatus Altiarchaeales archaeon]HEX55346.1 DUF359 domain-containing protein [Candidatus Altiarchaeales archaeon]
MNYRNLKLPDSMRNELKKPFGKLIKTLNEFRIDKYKNIICIGDRTSDIVLRSGIKPKVVVFDGREMRMKIEVPDSIRNFDAIEINIYNPAGHIREESFRTMETALASNSNFKIYVDGEEDLIALVAMKLAPIGSLVLYGQPSQGIVVVEINEEIKAKVDKIIEGMENED